MSKISEHDKKEVMNKLDFRNNGLFALSLEVEKVKTVKYVHEHNKRKEKYFDVRLVYQHFDMLLLDKIKPVLDDFSYKFNGAFRTLSVESDNDMDDTLRTWGIKRDNEGKAYELADAVAWCHNKDQKIDGCRILNLADELRVQMERDLLI